MSVAVLQGKLPLQKGRSSVGADRRKSTSSGGGPAADLQLVAQAQKTKQKVRRRPDGLGTMAPEDPFFFFCAQNFALCTYPADCIPKHFLGEGSSLVYHYSDVVSRTGTPEVSPRGQNQGLRDA